MFSHDAHVASAMVRFAVVCAFALCVAACDNGSVTQIPGAPTAPGTPTAPRIAITSVIPSVGPTLNYTVKFDIAAGTGCNTGLIGGGALVFDDGSVQDSVDANGYSGFPPLIVDSNCSGSGTSAAGLPQRIASLPNVMHVIGIAFYLSPPSSSVGSIPYPSLGAAVAKATFVTNLYMIAQPLGVVDPSPAIVAGTWSGNVQDNQSGGGALSLSLSQIGNEIFGTWSLTFARSSMAGSVTGAIFSGAVTLMLTPANSSCPIVLHMNGGATTAAATYAPAPACTVLNSGGGTLSKQ
jgi:hypothetical protein